MYSFVSIVYKPWKHFPVFNLLSIHCKCVQVVSRHHTISTVTRFMMQCYLRHPCFTFRCVCWQKERPDIDHDEILSDTSPRDHVASVQAIILHLFVVLWLPLYLPLDINPRIQFQKWYHETRKQMHPIEDILFYRFPLNVLVYCSSKCLLVYARRQTLVLSIRIKPYAFNIMLQKAVDGHFSPRIHEVYVLKCHSIWYQMYVVCRMNYPKKIKKTTCK